MPTDTIETLKPPQAEQLRHYDDVTTWAAEVLDGSMRTPFVFTPDENGELRGRDGLLLKPVFEKAIVSAKRKAQKDPSLQFEVRRSITEYGEFDVMEAMIRDELPNTTVVVSELPQELMNASEDVGGYNVSRKQTMLRVISKKPDGSISMVSQSLEGSNRAALEEIYDSLGFRALPGELLGQRMHLEIDPIEQEFLVDQLMGVYDRKLEAMYGGHWRAGWQLPTDRALTNTYDFVRQQDDLVQAFLADGGLNSQGVYGFAAAMQQRFEKFMRQQPVAENLIGGPTYRDPGLEMYHAASIAMAQGQTFSGCGVSVGVGGELSTIEELAESGYSTQDDDGPCEFISKTCPLCSAKNVKTVVTKTHITGACGCSLKK